MGSFFLMMMQNLFVSRHVILASMLLGVCLATSYGPVEVRALYSLTRAGKGTFVDATIELKGEELILKLKGEAFLKKQTLTIPEHLKIVSKSRPERFRRKNMFCDKYRLWPYKKINKWDFQPSQCQTYRLRASISVKLSRPDSYETDGSSNKKS